MKYFVSAVLICALVAAVSAAADCVKDQHGEVACGMGQCEIDAHGEVYCSEAGGGAIRDNYGEVQCGTGACAKDMMGQVWCSKVKGGGAAVDWHGKVKCLGGCEQGSHERCQKGQE